MLILFFRHVHKKIIPCSLQVVTLDLGDVVPSLSGPKRPHDRVAVAGMKEDFLKCLGNKVCTLAFDILIGLS